MSPKSLFAATPVIGTVLSREECQALTTKALSFATGPSTVVIIESTINGATRFSRNEVTSGTDAYAIKVTVKSSIDGRTGETEATQITDDGLRDAVVRAETIARLGPKRDVLHLVSRDVSYVSPTMWYEGAAAVEIEARTDVAHAAADAIAAAGYTAAGSTSVNAMAKAVGNSNGVFAYGRFTTAQLDVGARAPNNASSGWAHVAGFDWSAVDPKAVAAQAADRCHRMLDAVAIEPGRYTAIIEPAAYQMIMYWLMYFHVYRESAEEGYSVFAKKGGGTKLGLRVIDPRLSLVSAPADPIGPFLPFDDDGRPRDATKWIDHGVLTALAYDAGYGEKNKLPGAIDNPISAQLNFDGKTTSLEEMLATTKRGVYAVRTSGVNFADFRTMACTGVTRDGLWLVEDGKLTKPIKNFRFIDSPFFFLNELEQVGPPQLSTVGDKFTYVLPTLKVRDFNFTSLADAV